jgi:hypothetical protein
VFSRVARPAVSLFGWLQRKFNRPWNTPATDWALRDRHDTAMSKWAETRAGDALVLVAGHTHRPVFWNRPPERPSRESIDDLRRQLDLAVGAEQRARIRAKLGELEAKRTWMVHLPASVDSPCYFNTGCCSFADGDITGVELLDGEIRLIRWLDNDGEPRPKVLEATGLSEVFARVRELADNHVAARV